MLRSTKDHFSEKGFRKLDFPKIVSVTIIANSGKIKMKKSHPPTTLAFPLPCTFWFPLKIFLKIAPPTHFFGKFISPLQKRW